MFLGHFLGKKYVFAPLPPGKFLPSLGKKSAEAHAYSALKKVPPYVLEIPVYTVDNKNGLRPRYEKRCMPDCLIDR